MILPIHVYGDAILRQETTPVEAVTDELRTLAANMIETMYGAEGVGLAAPQVGRTERMFVADLTAYRDRDGVDLDAFPTQPMVFVNPEILWEGDEEVAFEEGCLSIPDLRERVWRPDVVGVRYRDLDFREHELEATGMLARVIQHEIDHLDGILFVQHLSAFRRKMIGRRLRDMQRGHVTADYPLALAAA